MIEFWKSEKFQIFLTWSVKTIQRDMTIYLINIHTHTCTHLKRPAYRKRHDNVPDNSTHTHMHSLKETYISKET